jgi:hypothetical protein
MAFDPVSALFEVGGKLIDKLIPDPAQKAAATIKLAELKQTGDLAVMASETDAFKAEQAAVTGRWTADMASDSWLSKNIRPIALIYVTVSTTAFAIASGFGYAIQAAYVTLFGQLLLLMFTAYFGGRTLEKVIALQNAKKN